MYLIELWFTGLVSSLITRSNSDVTRFAEISRVGPGNTLFPHPRLDAPSGSAGSRARRFHLALEPRVACLSRTAESFPEAPPAYACSRASSVAMRRSNSYYLLIKSQFSYVLGLGNELTY